MNDNQLTAKARIRIRKPAAEVFAAFADANSMSKFWFTRRDDGLKEGESVKWSVGSGDDAFSFDVVVKNIRANETIVIEWLGPDGNPTLVTWSFEETGDGDTILTIEETGFSGNDKEVIGQVLDSKGGFNQVIVAAKALIEHGIALNVVDDHV